MGVPQGSCLGPVICTVYSSPVFNIIDQHGNQGHACADDHQIYCSFCPVHADEVIRSMEHCIGEIKHWMDSMKLKMNRSKTEYILIGTQQQLAKYGRESTTMGDNVIESSDCVRNLGAYFDKDMSMVTRKKIKWWGGGCHWT